MAAFTGTSGDDNLIGTAGNDTFDLTQGGNDTAQGLAGNDVFTFGAAFTAADHVDGGAGTDALRLTGDYSAGVTFAAATMTGVESLQLGAGFNYNLTTDDANVAAGVIFRVEGQLLGAGNSLVFDGSNEADGRFLIEDGLGNDTISGGALSDKIILSGGTDTVFGYGGSDNIFLGASLTAADHIDGGVGNDIVTLDGDYSAGLILGVGTLTSVETLVLTAGHNYNITTSSSSTVRSAFTIDASGLGAGDQMILTTDPTSQHSYDIVGGAGNDLITDNAAVLGDIYDLSKGGNDHLTGGAGSDNILMGGAFNAGDRIDGGGGSDVIVLNGDYTGANAVVMGPATLTGVFQMQFSAGHDYDITLASTTVPAGTTFNVLASALSGSDAITVNGAAALGDLNFVGGLGGTETFIGGRVRDTFTDNGAVSTFKGNAGSDIFNMGSDFTAADSVDGGAGNDVVTMSDAPPVVFGATSLINVEILECGGGGTITTNDANVAAGQTLSVIDPVINGLGAGLHFDGSAETDGHFAFTNGGADDVFIGGALSDTFNLAHKVSSIDTGGGGADTFTAATPPLNGNFDTLIYNAVSDSTGVNYDTIHNWNFGVDKLQVSGIGAVTGVDAGGLAGSISTATFDGDLSSAVGAGQLAAHHAAMFTANAGTLSGHTFLVIDENGTAGYQSGGDLVIDVTGAAGGMQASSFT